MSSQLCTFASVSKRWVWCFYVVASCLDSADYSECRRWSSTCFEWKVNLEMGIWTQVLEVACFFDSCAHLLLNMVRLFPVFYHGGISCNRLNVIFQMLATILTKIHFSQRFVTSDPFLRMGQDAYSNPRSTLINASSHLLSNTVSPNTGRDRSRQDQG